MAQDGVKRVILDVDTGVDDAFAILAFLFAVKIGKVKVEAITLTYGNAPLPAIAENVVRILEIVGQTDVPIYAGASEPLITTDPPYAPNHFGKNGLCDVPHEIAPNLTLIQNKVAAIAINDIVMQSPGEITLICLGPLTNVALTMKLYSNFVNNVKEIFIMGGNYEAVGNTPTSSEFNFYMDPEAAHIVLKNSKCPITIFAYETALHHPTDASWLFNEVGTIQTPIMVFLNDVNTKLYSTKTVRRHQWTPFDFYLAIAVLYPSQIITQLDEFHAAVELSGILTRGQMVLDHRKTRKPNVAIIKKINVEEFKRIAYEILTKLQ